MQTRRACQGGDPLHAVQFMFSLRASAHRGLTAHTHTKTSKRIRAKIADTPNVRQPVCVSHAEHEKRKCAVKLFNLARYFKLKTRTRRCASLSYYLL